MSTSSCQPHEAAPAPCLRCATTGSTCCSIAPEDAGLCFPVSASERERILEHCSRQDCFVVEPNSRQFVENLKRLFPGDEKEIERLFPAQGTHMRLAIDDSGNCALLGFEGCSLPRTLRPWYCLLFPFWVHKGRLALFTPPGCVAVREAATIPRCLALMDLTERDVRRLAARLRLAWGLPPLDENGETL